MKEREGVEGTEWGWGNFCGVSVGPCSVSTENCREERDGEGGECWDCRSGLFPYGGGDWRFS